ncbi:MAG TPA: class I SAM-dependent methyltransferase [Candidatus Solibacter sp.]|nr:class I SAM-dependent methyltransferase [Candidatus Solibacter sp.]
MRCKPDYGIDSPVIITFQAIASLIAFVVAGVWPRLLDLPAGWIGLVSGLYFLHGAIAMASCSKVGKLKLRDQVLDAIPWRGDESVLDVGCGRGLLLVGAARRLTTGIAVGMDPWLPQALSGNAPQAVLKNAEAEGVSARVQVERGDVRQLPFADTSFDVVVSNFVVHEVNTPAEREAMLREMVRVLKPGGRLVLVDFIFTGHCVAILRAAGLDANRARIGRLSFWMAAILSFGSFHLYQVARARRYKHHPRIWPRA